MGCCRTCHPFPSRCPTGAATERGGRLIDAPAFNAWNAADLIPLSVAVPSGRSDWKGRQATWCADYIAWKWPQKSTQCVFFGINIVVAKMSAHTVHLYTLDRCAAVKYWYFNVKLTQSIGVAMRSHDDWSPTDRNYCSDERDQLFHSVKYCGNHLFLLKF